MTNNTRRVAKVAHRFVGELVHQLGAHLFKQLTLLFREFILLRIVAGGRKQFFALCQARAKALLLLREVWRRLSLPIGLLPKVGSGQEYPNPAEQD